jgi:hypothetical protein
MIDPSAIRERFAAVGRELNERTRRLFAAAEARTAGYGGIAASSRATGIARSTIGRGLRDLNDPAPMSGEVGRPGSGRPALTETDATLLKDLGQLLEPATKGGPMRPLRWVSKSHAKLAAALCAMGHQVSKSTIPKLLESLQYRRQVNPGESHMTFPCTIRLAARQAVGFQPWDSVQVASHGGVCCVLCGGR